MLLVQKFHMTLIHMNVVRHFLNEYRHKQKQTSPTNNTEQATQESEVACHSGQNLQQFDPLVAKAA